VSKSRFMAQNANGIATNNTWERARLDYTTLCQFFQSISAPLGEKSPEMENFFPGSSLLETSTWFRWHSPFGCGGMDIGLTMQLRG